MFRDGDSEYNLPRLLCQHRSDFFLLFFELFFQHLPGSLTGCGDAGAEAVSGHRAEEQNACRTRQDYGAAPAARTAAAGSSEKTGTGTALQAETARGLAEKSSEDAERTASRATVRCGPCRSRPER